MYHHPSGRPSASLAPADAARWAWGWGRVDLFASSLRVVIRELYEVIPCPHFVIVWSVEHSGGGARWRCGEAGARRPGERSVESLERRGEPSGVRARRGGAGWRAAVARTRE
eukprot:4084274-Prymnesium_polylepis.1